MSKKYQEKLHFHQRDRPEQKQRATVYKVSARFAIKKEENTLNWEQANNPTQEQVRDYVAQLQLHMALQARNLVPSLTQATNSREQFLQETQANVEKIASRQI